MISALAKLVVLQHLSELSRFEIHTDLVIDLKPLIRPDGTPHPTQLKLRDERPTVLRRRDEIPTPNGETPSLVLPLGVQRSENWAIMTLGDEWAYGTSPDGKILGRPDRHDHRRYSPYDVMTKISIELAGLESYDLQTVLAYSSTQHDFVMSEVGLLTDDDKEFVDDVYSSLVYGCRLPSMTMDQHQRDGRWMDGGSTDDEDDSMYDAPMELKQLLMTAVLGSCRMRHCDGVYDAAFLTGRLQEDAPLGPRRVLSEEESAELDGFLRSTNWTNNRNYWENHGRPRALLRRGRVASWQVHVPAADGKRVRVPCMTRHSGHQCKTAARTASDLNTIPTNRQETNDSQTEQAIGRHQV